MIVGYEFGDIFYFDKYMVIWVGCIVDCFGDYEFFFNENCVVLLDCYVVEYGLGWIWYEFLFFKEIDLYSG